MSIVLIKKKKKKGMKTDIQFGAKHVFHVHVMSKLELKCRSTSDLNGAGVQFLACFATLSLGCLFKCFLFHSQHHPLASVCSFDQNHQGKNIDLYLFLEFVILISELKSCEHYTYLMYIRIDTSLF